MVGGREWDRYLWDRCSSRKRIIVEGTKNTKGQIMRAKEEEKEMFCTFKEKKKK